MQKHTTSFLYISFLYNISFLYIISQFVSFYFCLHLPRVYLRHFFTSSIHSPTKFSIIWHKIIHLHVIHLHDVVLLPLQLSTDYDSRCQVPAWLTRAIRFLFFSRNAVYRPHSDISGSRVLALYRRQRSRIVTTTST